MDHSKTKRLRFTYNDDVSFLREVVAENPFNGALNLWENIQTNVQIGTGKLFTIKTLKNHLELLLEMFLKKVAVDNVRSGVEEPYCERDHLLQEIAIISSEYKENNIKKKKQASKEKQISDLGKKAREKYSSIFAERNEKLEENPIETVTVGCEEFVVDDDHTYGKRNIIPSLGPSTVNSEPPNALELAESTSTLQAVAKTSKETDGKLDVSAKNENALTPALKKNVIRPTRIRPKKETTLRKNAISYLTEKHERDRQIYVPF